MSKQTIKTIGDVLENSLFNQHLTTHISSDDEFAQTCNLAIDLTFNEIFKDMRVDCVPFDEIGASIEKTFKEKINNYIQTTKGDVIDFIFSLYVDKIITLAKTIYKKLL